MKSRQLPPWAPPLTAATCFIALAAPHVGLLGLGPDEAVHAEPAISWLKPEAFEVHWPYLPWMLSTYMGALKSWVLYIAFGLFGISVPVLRWSMLLLAAGGTAAWTWVTGRLYGRWLGLAAGLWIASDPAWVIKAGFDTGPVVLTYFCTALATACGLNAYDAKKRTPWAAACGLFLGLALWHKAHFAWWLIALIPSLWLCAKKELTQKFRRRDFIWATVGFALGAAPLLLFNIQDPFATLSNDMHQGWPLSQHLQNLGVHAQERFNLLLKAYSGHGIVWFTTGATEVYSPTRWIWYFYDIVFSALALWVGTQYGWKHLRAAAFWTLLCLGIVFAALLSPMPVKFHHLYILFPLTQVAAAALLKEVLGNKPHKNKLAAAGLVFVAILGAHAAMFRQFRTLARAGGSAQFSLAARELASWADDLKSQNPSTSLWASQGLGHLLPVYTAGRVHPHTFMLTTPLENMSDAQLEDQYGFLQEPKATIFLRHIGFNNDFPERLHQIAARFNVSDCLEEIRTFKQSSGRPWAKVFRTCDKAPGTLTGLIDKASAALSAGDPRRAGRALDRVFRRADDSQLRHLALRAQDQGQHRTTLIVLGELVRRRPKDAIALHDLGLSSFYNGDKNTAERHLRAALKLGPQEPTIYLSLGNLLKLSGRTSAGDEILKRGLTHANGGLKGKLEESLKKPGR
jgi:4-amino-4-deoxy-L-arabinose transferase-like glycosyltransferase